jgi:hypothetical protein
MLGGNTDIRARGRDFDLESLLHILVDHPKGPDRLLPMYETSWWSPFRPKDPLPPFTPAHAIQCWHKQRKIVDLAYNLPSFNSLNLSVCTMDELKEAYTMISDTVHMPDLQIEDNAKRLALVHSKVIRGNMLQDELHNIQERAVAAKMESVVVQASTAT